MQLIFIGLIVTLKINVLCDTIARGTSVRIQNSLLTDCETIEQATDEETEATFTQDFWQEGKRLMCRSDVITVRQR